MLLHPLACNGSAIKRAVGQIISIFDCDKLSRREGYRGTSTPLAKISFAFGEDFVFAFVADLQLCH